jgi:uroporphyrin-3 C-methyltransferase
MNAADPDSTSGSRPGVPPPAAAATAPRASRRLVAAVALVLAAAGVIGWLDARREINAVRSEVARRLGVADAAIASATSKQADFDNRLRDVEAKLTLVETRVGESQSQQAALETLYRDLAPSRDELALTEVEQVLALASQQVALGGNVQAALAALQLADAKLSRVDRPQLVPLRRSLARDIDELKSVPYVDVAGISAKLDQALSDIDGLPLAKDERLPPSAPEVQPSNEAAWLRFIRDVWADLKSLVRIEVSDRPAAPLVTPAQTYFLRENLRLRLLAARLALLARDQKSFRTDLTAANEWVKRYFDVRAQPVQALSATFTQLAATPMPATTPDLSRSLELARSLRMAREPVPERAALPRTK